MNESDSKKRSSLSRETWLSHIKACNESGAKQAAYCRKANISYSNFEYWRGLILKENALPVQEKFVSVKLEKINPCLTESVPRAIQIKLVSGNIIYIPATLSMPQIGELIRSLEGIHA